MDQFTPNEMTQSEAYCRAVEWANKAESRYRDARVPESAAAAEIARVWALLAGIDGKAL